MKASLQQQPMYCSRDHNYTSRLNQQYEKSTQDYYIVEDANESASFEYVPCVSYPNDKVYPEDEKNGWVWLDEDTGPPDIYRFEGSC